MARKITKVALAGATGNVGREALKHLLASKFEVTVLARKDGKTAVATQFPAGVIVKTVDPESVDELTAALSGYDAVVDTTRASDATQMKLVEAAAAAGVYRFIPSDFSLDPHNAKLNAIPVFAGKAARDEHLARKCAEPGCGMTWTIVCNGPFLDWNLQTGFMQIDLFGKKAALMDGGENVTVWTTLDDVGRAVAGVLLHPAETENRPVRVHTVARSPAQMLALARDALGTTEADWAVTSFDGEAAFAGAIEALKAGKADPAVFGAMILYANSRPDMAHPWAQPDNELLALKEMSDEQVKELIREIVKKGPLRPF